MKIRNAGDSKIGSVCGNRVNVSGRRTCSLVFSLSNPTCFHSVFMSYVAAYQANVGTRGSSSDGADDNCRDVDR